MTKDIQLFDYQEDMVKRVQEAFKHHDAVMVQMPTGTGKTMVLANIVFSFLEKCNHPIWIVAHRRELVSQIKDTLNKSLLIFSKTHPSSLTLKGGSTAFPKPLSPQGTGDVTALRCSEPLRSKVGGPSKVSPDCLSAGALKRASKVSPDCAGWDRLAKKEDSTSDILIEKPSDSSLFTLRSSLIKVVSIQWLSRHYGEMEEKPGLIVIDEAHHALAETYAEVMNAYPKAKKLGLTATPYRLNGKGFTDLFDTLLCSWSMEKFIAEGRLSLYDYYSIKPDSADQLLIDSLQKRGADGDYQQKELNEVMDVRPSLERLCLTIKEYVPGKKGIVYAISIQHAEHIAEFYRENGIKAVAISSKTPSSLRKELIERFKSSNTSQYFSNHPVPLSKEGSTSTPSPSSSEGGDVTALRCSEPLRSKVGGPSKVSPDCLSAGASKEALAGSISSQNSTSSLNSASNTSDEIEVLVSVDLFSEGFDCPDVEFIQLARPTLSLAKYMQMVGRGLRVTEGKEYCVILDNVGLYKRFGLPSVDRDWQSMFEGRTSLEDILQEACMQVNSHNCRMDVLMDGDEEMMKIINHDRQQQMIMDTYGYQIVEDEKGLKGIKDKDGKMILECQYKKIEVTNDGFAYCYIRKKVGRKEWIDLQNRLWFANKPQSVKLMGIDFSTEDGKRLYPRIQSKYIDEKTYLTVKTLELQVGTGLSWKHRFIPWDDPNKVYLYKEGEGNSRLYIDENEQYYVQKNIGSQLEKVDSREALAEFAQRDKEERKESLEKLKNSYKHYEYYPVDNLYPIKKYLGTAKDKITIEKDGIWHVEDAQVNESYWVDPITHRKHYTRPVLFKRGYLNILREGDWCYVRNIPGLRNRPLRQWEIVADDNICVINNKYLIEKRETDQWYKICRRTDDFSYFSVLACFYESEYIKDDTEIQITQFDGENLKMTQEGMPYTPLVIKTYKRRRW
jgi:superfamily II DNA or RNA helicase